MKSDGSESGLVLSSEAVRILPARYLRRNEKGEVIETPDQMFWRVAENIASAEFSKTSFKSFPKASNITSDVRSSMNLYFSISITYLQLPFPAINKIILIYMFLLKCL